MTIGKLFGVALVLAALAVAMIEIALAHHAGDYRAFRTGELWYWLSPESLGAARSAIVGALHPAVWEPGLTSVLRLPGWTVLGLPGLMLVLVARPRSRARFA